VLNVLRIKSDSNPVEGTKVKWTAHGRFLRKVRKYLNGADLTMRNWQATESFPGQLAPGLWVMGNYYFNLYLAQGEQVAALIEVGVSAVVDSVVSQLRSLKVAPSFLVVTHPHPDHVTGLDGLRERFPQVLVVTGEGAPDFLASPQVANALVREDRHMTEFLAANNIEPGRPPVVDPPSLMNCLVARDGDEMDLGNLTLRFMAVDGHAPGTIIVHIPEINALLLSDSLGFRFPGRGIFPLFFTGYSGYMETLDRLEGLRPEILGVAHQGPLAGDQVGHAFQEARDHARKLRDRILAHRDPEEAIQDVFREFYKDEIAMYSKENIMECARLLVKRARE
jgi:2-aminobenzoylacetyl-CoA thioesterase